MGGIKENTMKKSEFAWETHAPEILLFFSHMLPRSLVIFFFVEVGVRATAKSVRRRGSHTHILYFIIFYECVRERERETRGPPGLFFLKVFRPP